MGSSIKNYDKDTGDSILFTDLFNFAYYNKIFFSDGLELAGEEIVSRLVRDSFSNGDDHFVSPPYLSYDFPFIIDGLGGNDTLDGRISEDIIVGVR